MQKELTQKEEDRFQISPEAVNSDESVNVLNHSNTFGLFDRAGNIYHSGRKVQGIYHNGTRFINELILTINGHKPLLLSSTIKEDNDIFSIDLANPAFENGSVPENTIHISRNQFVREGAFHEEIICVNYGEKICHFDLCLFFNGDFRDIFEIRGLERKVAVNKPVYAYAENGIKIQYEGQDKIRRQAVVDFSAKAAHISKKTGAKFFIDLQPDTPLNICYCISFLIGEDTSKAESYKVAKESIQIELNNNRSLFADIRTSNEQFSHWINRSRVDLLSLLATTDQGVQYPYAGVPWYNTSFGRDGIITAMQTLWLAPEISRNVLLFLARKQAVDLIAEKDAEPGKILHEARSGEMANTGEVPFKEYYGTIDATPLFVMLAGMYYDRTADTGLIKKIWPNLVAAVNWIDKYGDIDGDGFVEYQHKAKNGLTNQGWKDSFDAVMHEDGKLAEPPIALCEVQSYVYGAKKYAGRMAHMLGEDELSARMFVEAEAMKKNFNEKFWDEALGCYILALDGEKRPCRVVSSNSGHCLFTGIADPEKARRMADRMLADDMFSGWGIRTLSVNEKAFNPMSYHNGSVWPHDNALIAYGLSLYGFHNHVLKIMEAIFSASLFISLQRMPELYCGFDRKSNEGPAAYPVACSPQAWSVAVVFMLLQACIRVDINAVNKTIVFDKPRLPRYLEYIYLNNLMLMGKKCNIHMKRLGSDVGFYLLEKPEGWEVLIKK